VADAEVICLIFWAMKLLIALTRAVEVQGRRCVVLISKVFSLPCLLYKYLIIFWL
jgi:hypothetical protein